MRRGRRGQGAGGRVQPRLRKTVPTQPTRTEKNNNERTKTLSKLPGNQGKESNTILIVAGLIV